VALQKELLLGVLRSVGIMTADDVDTIQATSKQSSFGSTSQEKVAQIGTKIIQAAIQYCQEELEKAQRKAQAHLDTNAENFAELLEQDAQVVFWKTALLRLYGENQKHPHEWDYLFLHSEHPNAFVTELLPHRFFITQGLVNAADNPHEMAVILGHEISHLILGHVSQTNQVSTWLRTIEVLLLTLDPTAGVLSVAMVGLIASAHWAVAASFSREQEYQADAMGLEICARACFDTQVGAQIFLKLDDTASADEEMVKAAVEGKVQQHSILDSHPATLERYRRVLEQSEETNRYKYNHCCSATTRLYRHLFVTKQQQEEEEEEEVAVEDKK